jgi:hypothetical protein
LPSVAEDVRLHDHSPPKAIIGLLVSKPTNATLGLAAIEAPPLGMEVSFQGTG